MASPHRVSALYARMYFSFKEIRDQNQKKSCNRGNYHTSNECNINLMFTSHKFVPQFLVSFDIVSLQKWWALPRVLSSVATTTMSTCPAMDFIKLFLFGSRAWQKIRLKWIEYECVLEIAFIEMQNYTGRNHLVWA